jgi:hypothetical protein
MRGVIGAPSAKKFASKLPTHVAGMRSARCGASMRALPDAGARGQ